MAAKGGEETPNAGSTAEPVITTGMLKENIVLEHLMSVDGGCQTEEQARAHAAIMIEVLNKVAAYHAAAAEKHKIPTLPLPPPVQDQGTEERRSGPGDEEDIDVTGGSDSDKPKPAKLQAVEAKVVLPKTPPGVPAAAKASGPNA